MKLGQGNIFRSKCQEFCPQEGGSLGSHPGGRLRGLAWGGSPGPHPGGVSSVKAQAQRMYFSMHLGRQPPGRQHAVRILLKCILVVYIFYLIFIFFLNIAKNIKSILSNIIELPQVSQ